MTNLFPLPYWAPALRRVPVPAQVLNEAYASPPTMAWRRDLEPWMPSVKQVAEVAFNLLRSHCVERSEETRHACGTRQ
jgi:hypothetical protein